MGLLLRLPARKLQELDSKDGILQNCIKWSGVFAQNGYTCSIDAAQKSVEELVKLHFLFFRVGRFVFIYRVLFTVTFF